jgi:hypothetical protein
MLRSLLGRTEEDKDMSTFNTTRSIGIMIVAIVAAATAFPASAAWDRSGKFAPPNWPEETTYPPECRIVQGHGTWLPCSAVDCDQYQWVCVGDPHGTVRTRPR